MAVTYDTICGYVRACVMSCKGGVDIRNFEKDYSLLIGDHVPYKKLGFNNLQEFLQSVNGIYTKKVGGNIILGVTPSKETEHISRLVAGQKSSKKKNLKKISPRATFHPQQRFTAPYNTNSDCMQRNKYVKNAFKYNSNYSKPNHLSNQQQVNSKLQKSFNTQNSYQKPQEQPALSSKKQDYQKQTPFVNTTSNEVQVPREDKKSDNVGVLLTPLSPGYLVRSTDHRRSDKVLNVNVAPVQKKEVISEIKPKSKTISINEADAVSQLRELATSYNMGDPVYKIKTANKYYYASVEVSSDKYSSYPTEAKNVEDAKNIAAKIALSSLLQNLTLNGPSNLLETTDQSLVLTRVKEIIQEHYYGGVFEEQMNCYYVEKYNEKLPNGWFELIQQSKDINVETTKNEKVILSVISKPQVSQISLNTTVPDKLVCPPETENWPVFVTHVTNTDSIWARLANENSIAFEKMASEMTSFYNERKVEFVTNTIHPEHYYTYFEGDYWHRVKCEKIDTYKNVASIFFIDHGDSDNVNPKLLYNLVDKYLSLPPQAIRLSLYGLEDWMEFNDDMIISTIEKYLLENQELFVNIVNTGIYSKYALFIQIINNKGENLNKIILSELLQKCESAEDALKFGNRIVTTSLSHVTQKGEVFLNVHTDSYKYFKGLHKKLQQNIPIHCETLQQVEELDTNKIYCTNKLNGSTWHRAKIMNRFSRTKIPLSEKEVEVFLIDHGAKILVNAKDLIPVEILLYSLAEYPAQAVQVKLHHISQPMCHDMIYRFQQLANGELLTKIVEPPTLNSLAEVELFIRVSENNMLASINSTLEVEQTSYIELNNNGQNFNSGNQQSTSTKNVNTRNKDWMELLPRGNTMTKFLMPPEIPYNADNYFNVRVNLAANPNYFIVQPFDMRFGFREMCTDLNKDCERIKNTCQKLTIDNVVKGNLYAAYHSQNKWGRIYVKDILNNTMVTIYFCDYGEIVPHKISDLLPLEDKYLTFPYQALHARLVGVKPINKDWSLEDILCFKKLVENKNLISIIMGISYDSVFKEPILKLKLIDTATQADIHIDELLISQNHALPDIV